MHPERLERIVVQLVEARRLANFNDVAHGRLALLLLDNVAETLLSRRAEEALIWADWHGNLLKTLEREGYSPKRGSRSTYRGAKSESSIRQDAAKEIRQNFSDLVRFVFSRADCELAPELAGCLNALHRYRNAADHQDLVRNDVLGPANEIYFYLCCQLLKHQKNMVMEIAPPPAVVVEVFGGGQLPEQFGGLLTDDKMMGEAVADELLAQYQLDHDGIASALAAHLDARIDLLERNLDEFIEYLDYPDRATAVRSIELLPLSYEPSKLPDDFWTRSIPVTERVITGWKRRAAAIGRVPSGQDALRQFDDIELAVSKFEEQLEPFTIAIDREVQHEIDLRRGK